MKNCFLQVVIYPRVSWNIPAPIDIFHSMRGSLVFTYITNTLLEQVHPSFVAREKS